MDDSSRHSTTIITLHGDVVRLRGDVDRLRETLATLVTRRDDMLLQEIPGLEAEFSYAFGDVQLREYRLDCAVRRAELAQSLIQARINRQEPVRVDEIESALDEEFAEYEAKIQTLIHSVQAAMERMHAGVLSTEETAELKTLYRAIVRALHPDLHPNATENDLRLFTSANEALEHGDIHEMRLIAAVVLDPDAPTEAPESRATIEREYARLTAMIADVQGEICTMESQFPYTMKDLLADTAAVARRRAEFERRIEHLEQALALANARVAALLEANRE